jgi:UrcA family protein
MEIEARSTRPSINLYNAPRIAALAALIALASAAIADPSAPPSGDTRSAKVSLAGLDLSTPEGYRAALERLKIMAQHLCWQMGDDLRASNRATLDACVRETLAEAARQVKAPTLAIRDK